ncbi:MAG: hypothetical protein ACLS90_04580 [Clostridia bacterium]
MIKKAFDNLQINLADIDLFACSKGLVLLQELELGLLPYVLLEITIIAIGISSLESLAYNIILKKTLWFVL